MSGNIFNKQGFGIPVIIRDGEDYLSLTAMCKDCGYKPADAIRNFFSNKDVLRFVVTRQIIEDPEYMARLEEFDVRVGRSADPNYDVIVHYVDNLIDRIRTGHERVSVEALISEYGINCIYIKKGGRDSGQGIYAHHDIALHFATWLNPAYGVFVNKDYQRLKSNELDEMSKRGLKWKFDRRDAATWHRMMKSVVHSVVVPTLINQIPEEVLETDTMTEEVIQQTCETLAAETMIAVSNYINVAVFGMTAKEWRDANPDKKGNMRDYATEDELNLVSYLEYQLSQIIMENPLNRNKWRKEALRIAKECRNAGISNTLTMFRSEQEVTPVEPISYETRTVTAQETATARFKNELLTGKIRYDEKDNVFRNKDGFICLGWKI